MMTPEQELADCIAFVRRISEHFDHGPVGAIYNAREVAMAKVLIAIVDGRLPARHRSSAFAVMDIPQPGWVEDENGQMTPPAGANGD